MRRGLLVVLIAGAAFIAYRGYTHSPVRTYEAFAEEILKRHYDGAAAMAEGLTPADLAERGSQERIGAGPAMFQTLFRSRFDIESQEKAADGATKITARQTVFFNPPGVESAARPAMYAVLRQIATVRKGKVVAFENTFEKMDSVSYR